MLLPHYKKANVYSKKHRSGNLTWCVDVGKKIDGKKNIRNFISKEEAKHFANEWNLNLANKNNPGLTDLSDVSRHEILAAVGKLKAFDATLAEAVDFFIRFARPSKGIVTIREALDIFLKTKSATCKAAYLRSIKKTFVGPFANAFSNRKVTEITDAEADNYINSHKNWSVSTRASHVSYLRTFYEFLKKRGYAKLNPFQGIEKPRFFTTSAKTIKPNQVKSLLQFAFDKGYKPECASMTLVFFCGVRVDEVERLSWDQIDLKRKRIKVEPEQSKKARRRVNDISENAFHWLSLCKRSHRIAPNDYAQKMKRLRARSKIAYPQNAMRHCFASYHIAKVGDAMKTALMLGHSNPTLLYRTYYDVVDPDDVNPYWEILPDSVLTKRAEAEKRRLQEEKEEAECQSNCGTAIFDNGSWHPFHDESV